VRDESDIAIPWVVDVLLDPFQNDKKRFTGKRQFRKQFPLNLSHENRIRRPFHKEEGKLCQNDGLIHLEPVGRA